MSSDWNNAQLADVMSLIGGKEKDKDTPPPTLLPRAPAKETFLITGIVPSIGAVLPSNLFSLL